MILGAAFLGVKAKEYNDKYEECHIPGHVIGKGFNTWGGCSATDPKLGNIAEEIRERDPNVPEVAAVQTAKQTEIFFSFYFAMTGLHAFHMVIGFGLLLWLTVAGKTSENLGRNITRLWSWAACTGILSISCGFISSRCCI